MEQKSKVQKPVQLPEGQMMTSLCADCKYRGAWNDKREQYWCGHYSMWVDGGDGCSYGEEH